jgi:hypothetical protein
MKKMHISFTSTLDETFISANSLISGNSHRETFALSAEEK